MASGKERTFDVKEAEELFKKTPSWSVVGKALGVHRFCIQSALEPLGYATVKSRGQFRIWDVEKAAELKAKGVSVREIAEMMGVAERTIWRGLAEKKEKVPERFKKKKG
jgi:hypothetical protein